MTEDTPTQPPAASDAIEAVAWQLWENFPYSLPAWESLPKESNEGMSVKTFMQLARSAIAAYHAALPSEHANLKQELSGFSPYSLGGLSLAAITALEARLADARAEMQAAANQFQFYADEHVKKGSYDKAATNCDWARRLHDAAEKMANG